MHEVIIPVCDPKGHFRDKHGKTVDSLARNCLRFVIPDRAAIVSLLQFGAIIPPLSPWEGISRLLPGYVHSDNDRRPMTTFASLSGAADVDECLRQFAIVLDETILRMVGEKRAPIVLFSGGVDSGLIAARLAHLGYLKTLLINCSFGPDDRESALAEAMAAKLGLQFERVGYNYSMSDVLDCPGKLFNFPFGDVSVAPTYALAKAVISMAKPKSVIFDGTGADGAFGMARKIVQWQKVAKLPRYVSGCVSAMYRNSKLWRQINALEYGGRILRRSSELPLLSAIIAQNPLAGILYRKEGRHEVETLLDDWMTMLCGPSLIYKAIMADLALTCANTFAQKAHSVLSGAEHKIEYPFMDQEMVKLALAIAPRSISWENKILLKALLSRHVPAEMIYRPKCGFVDQSKGVFFTSKFIDMLWAATESDSALSEVLYKKPLKHVCDMLKQKKKLPDQLLNCIWTIVFVDRWYRTA